MILQPLRGEVLLKCKALLYWSSGAIGVNEMLVISLRPWMGLTRVRWHVYQLTRGIPITLYTRLRAFYLPIMTRLLL
jgi:hypothetical protein